MLKKLVSPIATRLKRQNQITENEDAALPFPPLELRRLVGPTDVRDFDNPDGRLIWGDLAYGPLEPGEAYQRVFDFGCGCGRVARQLLLQHAPPVRYVGVDISTTMLEWCQENLSRPGVEFYHHDVYSPAPGYGSLDSTNKVLPLRQHGTDFTLIVAFSVFTHLLEPQARFYLQELQSMLAENGLFMASWFFFNRAWFPILNPNQHCLYVNDSDPTQAVYYDWHFFVSMVRQAGLKIVDVHWAEISGHQSMVFLARGEAFQDRSETIEPSGRILGFGASAPPLSIQELRSAALPDSAFEAQISVPQKSVTAEAGSQITLEVKVKNVSDVAWPVLKQTGNEYRIRLGNHWLDEHGKFIINDDGRTALPHDLKSLEEITLPLVVSVPSQPGSYVLELDMVQELVAWFKDKGSETTKIQVQARHS